MGSLPLEVYLLCLRITLFVLLRLLQDGLSHPSYSEINDQSRLRIDRTLFCHYDKV